MARTETIKINFDIQTASINELEKELAQINDELKEMKQNDAGFEDKAAEAAKLTNQLNKANAAAEGFTDDKKFLAADGAIKAMSGAVTGVVGALGLLGIESEVFGEMEKKAASAIAVGLGIKDISEGFRDLKKSGMLATAQTKIFGAVTKKALIATGIGAFVVLLGTVVAYWEDIVKFVEGADRAQAKFIDGLNEELELEESSLSVIESQIALQEAQGESTLESNKALLKTLELQIDITNQLIEQKKLQLQEERDENAEVSFWEKVRMGLALTGKSWENYGTVLADSVNPENEKTKELLTEINELQVKNNQLQGKYIEVNQEVDKQKEIEHRGIQQTASAITSVGVATMTTGEITATVLDENTAKEIQKSKADKLALKTAQEQEELEYAKAEAMYATGEAMGALGDVIGQETAAGKALASAQALINTYLGVTEVLKQESTLPSPFDVIVKVANVATILASGLAAVKNINSVPVSTTGTASGGGGGINQTAAQPPSIDLAGATQAAAPETQTVQPTVRAYVLTGDVNSSQEADAQIRFEYKAVNGTISTAAKLWSGGNFNTAGYITVQNGGNTITNTRVGQWNTAYGWGNHASAGYSTFSGSYNDLTNKPTIPTNNNQLTNGAGYITSFDITTQTDSKYLRSNADDTSSGSLTVVSYKFNGNASNPTNTTATIYDQSNVGLTASAHNFSIRNYNGSSMVESARFTTGSLTVIGDVIAFGTPSDISFKENIKPIENALDKVEKLQGVTFDWKESDSILDIKQDIGFIAQDVQKVLPELVRKNDNGKLSLRHQGIISVLTEAIKELSDRIKVLEDGSTN